MPTKSQPLMPIDDLRIEDIRRYAVWHFAEDVESEPDQDETSVEPWDVMEVPVTNEPVFVATDYEASDGTEFLGLVVVLADPEASVQPCAIVTSETYAPLARVGEGMAESVLSFAEKQLGRSRRSTYPLKYTLRVLLEGETTPRSGRFDLPPISADQDEP